MLPIVSGIAREQAARMDWDFGRALVDRKDFQKGNGESVASALTRNHSSIVKMTRYAIRMNGFAARPVDVSVAYGVGKGMSPVISNQPLLKLWKRWTKHAGAEGLGDFGFVQEQAWREWWIGGECFGYLRFRSGKKAERLAVPLQVQILPTEMVPTQTPFVSGAFDGQLLDKEGDTTDYYIYKQHPGDRTNSFRADAEHVFRVKADLILHVMKQNEAGARRGEPWLTRALIKIHDLEKYYGAELTRKILTSNIAYWLKLPDLTDEEKEELASIEYDPATGKYYNADNVEVQAPIERTVVAPESGSVATLPNGAEIQVTAPAESGNTFAPFVREIKLAIASSVNIPMEFLFGDVAGLNDRIYKGLAQQFERQIDAWRRDFNAMFNVPVWNAWLRTVVAEGLWTPPEGETIEDYLDVDFAGQPFPNLHRAQEVASWKEEVASHFATESDIIRRQGDDPDRVRRERLSDLVSDIQSGLQPIPEHWTDRMIVNLLGWSQDEITSYRALSAPV
jgi:lambda family phage portal protein